MDERLVDRIYEAAVVPDLWRAVLVDLAKLAGAAEAVIIVGRESAIRSRDNPIRWVTSSPTFDQVLEDYFAIYPLANERTGRLMAAGHPGFLCDADIFTPDEIDNEPIYRDFLFPRGYGSGVATSILAPSGDTVIVHAENAGRRDASRALLDTLDGLRPHFARAGLLAARLEMDRARSAVDALDAVGLPAAVLGHGGRALAANPLLARLMPGVVQDRPRRLGLANPLADRLLVEAVAAVAAGHEDEVTCSIPVPASDGHPPVIVHLVPVRGAAHDVFTHAATILVATPVVPRQVASATVVAGLFDLTPAESKLATQVAGGRQPREAAALLGWSYETARTTLKQVMAKVGVERQAELVGLLATTLASLD